ncbi:MAG: acyl-CoA synthetase [Alphaproteobacteria bacterium]|nr:acyl-CoA synthetase [Alphaproteobacteria bacterium]
MNDHDAKPHPYELGLDRCQANYAPLSPLGFLARSAAVYPDQTAIVYGDRRLSYRAFYGRCRRLAAALDRVGVGINDTVAVMAPNIPEMLECHHGVPMAGAVLNAINIRLDSATVGFILDHASAKVLIADREYGPILRPALDRLAKPPVLVEIDDPAHGGETIGGIDYEAFLADADPGFTPRPPADEWQAIALGYTSGTTGDPKGVVTHHRGAYLNALAGVMATELNRHSIYLWTLPMFHCNGWCFTWAVCAVAGTHVCLRQVEPAAVFRAIARHKVTTLCGAPIVLNMLIHAPAEARVAFDHRCRVFTGGAAPPSTVIAGMERLGFAVTQLYGLTESYGPSLICAWQEPWEEEALEDRAPLMARQGVTYPLLEAARVGDPETGRELTWDGETLGEIMLRGNTVMKGYLNNAEATKAAFRGGWFHTGDLAVRHPDGYIEVKDRSKDIIISGGENISSLEVEEVLYSHEMVIEAAVVARADPKWGESPCAFVTLKAESDAVSEADIIGHCRDRMAHFKVPRTVIFGPLPKTATGKIQKFALRARANALAEDGDR